MYNRMMIKITMIKMVMTVVLEVMVMMMMPLHYHQLVQQTNGTKTALIVCKPADLSSVLSFFLSFFFVYLSLFLIYLFIYLFICFVFGTSPQRRLSRHSHNTVSLSRHCIPSLCIDRLVGLVVKASASRAEDPGLESSLRRDFSEVESYQ